MIYPTMVVAFNYFCQTSLEIKTLDQCTSLPEPLSIIMSLAPPTPIPIHFPLRRILYLWNVFLQFSFLLKSISYIYILKWPIKPPSPWLQYANTDFALNHWLSNLMAFIFTVTWANHLKGRIYLWFLKSNACQLHSFV